MPFFKTTYNILKTPWEDEAFDVNWMDSNKIVLPPNKPWDYARELKLEDVSLWEQIYYQGGGLGLYASWDPYAEFYMITSKGIPDSVTGINLNIETFYGEDAGKKAYKKAISLGMPIQVREKWVDPEDMWLYPTTKITGYI
jgi:hypothetical protein